MNHAKSVEMILAVPSVEDSVEWYERVLGWEGGFDVFDADGNRDPYTRKASGNERQQVSQIQRGYQRARPCCTQIRNQARQGQVAAGGLQVVYADVLREGRSK